MTITFIGSDNKTYTRTLVAPGVEFSLGVAHFSVATNAQDKELIKLDDANSFTTTDTTMTIELNIPCERLVSVNYNEVEKLVPEIEKPRYIITMKHFMYRIIDKDNNDKVLFENSDKKFIFKTFKALTKRVPVYDEMFEYWR